MNIFVKSNLSPEELTLLVRHELYHNHAQHNFRHTKHFTNKNYELCVYILKQVNNIINIINIHTKP